MQKYKLYTMQQNNAADERRFNADNILRGFKSDTFNNSPGLAPDTSPVFIGVIYPVIIRVIHPGYIRVTVFSLLPTFTLPAGRQGS
jgi:hypothetical protein